MWRLILSLAIEIGVALNAPALTSLAPIGGIALCLAWFCLVIAGLLLPTKLRAINLKANDNHLNKNV